MEIEESFATFSNDYFKSVNISLNLTKWIDLKQNVDVLIKNVMDSRKPLNEKINRSS